MYICDRIVKSIIYERLLKNIRMIQREIACKKIFKEVPFYQRFIKKKKHLKTVESSLWL